MRNFCLFLFSLLLICSEAGSVETCSRIAIINFQEVLVDSNATDKGEGLRYQLEKDPIAREYLNTYQKNSSIKLPSAILGTAGTGLLLLGFFSSKSPSRQTYFVTGAATILVNFLVARTLEVTNEVNLTKAVEEYNKRNLPKIFFNTESNLQGNIVFPAFNVGFNKVWSF